MMKPLDVEALPADVTPVVRALAMGMRDTFSDNLSALYVYGSITFKESAGIGDLDFHAFLCRRPQPDVVMQYDALRTRMAANYPPLGGDLDGWLIATSNARRRASPEHLLRPGLRDDSWGLHRAHWLAGHVVVLHGPVPQDFVLAPEWVDLAIGLEAEWHFLCKSEDDAFAVLNACRVLFSFSMRAVVVSKYATAQWALDTFPKEFRPPIIEALATYGGTRPPHSIDGRGALISYIASLLPVEHPTW
jgi:hypothetical protein